MINSRYQIQTLKSHQLKNRELLEFFIRVGVDLAARYDSKFKWERIDLQGYADRSRLTLCRRDGYPIGIMMSQLYKSVFDGDTRILMQDLLYSKPGTRAAYFLMKDFVDFGRQYADHIISTRGMKTNIKPRTLEKLGFKKIEELYRIEV